MNGYSSDDDGDHVYVNELTGDCFTPEEVSRARQHYKTVVQYEQDIDFLTWIGMEWSMVDPLKNAKRSAPVSLTSSTPAPAEIAFVPTIRALPNVANNRMAAFAPAEDERAHVPVPSKRLSLSAQWQPTLTETEVQNAARVFFRMVLDQKAVDEVFSSNVVEATRLVDKFLAMCEKKGEDDDCCTFSSDLVWILATSEEDDRDMFLKIQAAARTLAAASSKDPTGMVKCSKKAFDAMKSENVRVEAALETTSRLVLRYSISQWARARAWASYRLVFDDGDLISSSVMLQLKKIARMGPTKSLAILCEVVLVRIASIKGEAAFWTGPVSGQFSLRPILKDLMDGIRDSNDNPTELSSKHGRDQLTDQAPTEERKKMEVSDFMRNRYVGQIKNRVVAFLNSFERYGWTDKDVRSRSSVFVQDLLKNFGVRQSDSVAIRGKFKPQPVINIAILFSRLLSSLKFEDTRSYWSETEKSSYVETTLNQVYFYTNIEVSAPAQASSVTPSISSDSGHECCDVSGVASQALKYLKDSGKNGIFTLLVRTSDTASEINVLDHLFEGNLTPDIRKGRTFVSESLDRVVELDAGVISQPDGMAMMVTNSKLYSEANVTLRVQYVESVLS